MGQSTHALLLLTVMAVSCSLVAANTDVEKICKGTPYPALCNEMAEKQASRYPTVDAIAVLKMQVDGFQERTLAAQKLARKSARVVSLPAKMALVLCNKLYGDVEDNLGAARRAIRYNDAVTIRAMMGMAAQDMQGCDERFRKVGEKNPVDLLNESLLQISENCRALSNMI